MVMERERERERELHDRWKTEGNINMMDTWIRT